MPDAHRPVDESGSIQSVPTQVDTDNAHTEP